MDDPWGSPWTSNNDDFGSFASASTADSPGPKPPQPVLLAKVSNQTLNGKSSNSGAVPPTLSFSSLEPSPWADNDDDNFGDWTAADGGGGVGGGGGLSGTPGGSTRGFAGGSFGGSFGGSAGGALGWADAFNDNRLSPRPKDRASQPRPQPSPVPWQTSIARPPGALTSRSRASSVFSRASSDPWGSRDELPREKVEERTDENDAASFASFASFAEAGEARTAAQPQEAEPATANDTSETTDAKTTQNASRQQSSAGYGTEAESPVESQAESPVESQAESRTESHSDQEHEHDEDRHEDHEDRDDHAQHDSPTTSVEDMAREDKSPSEPKGPTLLQSSKVQNLVELFDGLAQRPVSASGSPSVPGSRSASATRSVSPTRSVSATRPVERPPSRDEEDVKEAVKEAVEETDVPSDPVSEPPSGPPKPPSEPLPSAATAVVQTAPQATVKNVENAENVENDTPKDAAAIQLETNSMSEIKDGRDDKHDKKDQNDNEAAPAATPILSANALLTLYGQQEPYATDTPTIDRLFSSFPVQPTKPRPEDADLDAFVPDGYILDDSFTTISERRVWYRISRHGSSRKHNAGGNGADNALDASYRPVTWAASTVLADTVKIVRRWMEEDSFTGKPTLGAGLYHGGGAAGSRGSNMFGWDSAAEPVTLDQVFKRPARPHAHAHARTLSHTHPASAVASAASAFGWGSDAPLPKEAPVRHSVHLGGMASLGSFGQGNSGGNVWATPEAAPAAPTTPTETLASPARSSFGFDAGSRPAYGPSPGSLPPPPKLVPRPSPLSVGAVAKADVATAAEDEDEDEDEWGEMVMSPTAGGSSSFPAPLMPVLSPTPVPILAPPRAADPVDFSSVDSILGGLPDLSYMSR